MTKSLPGGCRCAYTPGVVFTGRVPAPGKLELRGPKSKADLIVSNASLGLDRANGNFFS